MATAAISYSSPATITLSLAPGGVGLASSATAGRESTAVDNSSNLYIDAIVGGFITVGTTPTANTFVEVWVYGSYDGTNYSGGATGSDAALTPTQQAKTYMKLGAILPVTATTSNIKHTFTIGSVAALFGGVLPTKWGLYVQNQSGVALNATGSNHEFKYLGIKYTSA